MNRPEIVNERNGFPCDRADFAAFQTWYLQFAEKREHLDSTCICRKNH